ncbi:hypothetical protein BY458DRAFT_85925 [Sporodiniella umbellata]|nr:hypothetical protein BY458DRAFT_85925 [Sporodiniella umbellata]
MKFCCFRLLKLFTFFAMSLFFHQFYTFTELARLSLLTNKPDLLNLIEQFKLHFIRTQDPLPPSNQNLSAFKCATLSREKWHHETASAH